MHVICSSKFINYEIVELLIENGIKINKLNKEKDTALDLLQKAKLKDASLADINHAVEQYLILNKAIFNTQKPKASDNDPRLKKFLDMVKLGVPLWGVIQHMKKTGADRGLIADVEKMLLEQES